MNCNEVGALVARYADGELDALQGRSIEQHLWGWAACQATHQGLLALREGIRTEVPYSPAPPALRTRIQAMLADAPDAARVRRPPTTDRWRWLGGGVLAGCAATVLAWVVGT